MPHRGDAQRRPLGRDPGRDDEVDRLIFQNGLFAGAQFGLRILAAVLLYQFRLLGKEADQLRAGVQKRVGLPVNMAVVQI